MAKRKTIIVVGGSHGGPSAVAHARQANEKAKIILVEQAPHVMWVQPSLRHQLLEDSDAFKQALLEREKFYEQRYDVEVRKNTKAISLDLDSNCLVVEKDSKRERLAFDSLIYAGGARANQLEVPGLLGPRFCYFRNWQDICSIKQAINEGAKTALVVGCGFYGVEAAMALKAAGLKVRVIEQKNRIIPSFSLNFAEAILAKLQEQDIKVDLKTNIKSAALLDEKGFAIELDNGQNLKTDLVVACVGISAQNSFLCQSGAALDAEGLVWVNDNMETSLPKVYACGSAVSVPMAVINQRRWMPHPTTIFRTAQIAGANAARQGQEGQERLKPFCGTLLTEVGDTAFCRTGLAEHEAQSFLGGENIIVSTVFGSSVDGLQYQQEMCVRLLVDKAKNQVVGGEVYGQRGVERIIDLLSVATMESWSPEKILDVDMAYLLTSGPSFDPLKDAALRATMAVKSGENILSAQQLALWLANNQDFRLVDVGDSFSLQKTSVKKAINIPLESLRARIGEINADGTSTPVVLFSKSGHKSYLAHLALKQRGFNNVFHLDGGMSTWKLIVGEDV